MDLDGATSPYDVSLRDYQRRVAEAKRTATLAAARDHFQQHGYTNTSLEGVARRAGVSTATVYKHFPTKAALFEAASESLFPPKTLELPPWDSTSPWDALRYVLSSYASMLTQPGTAAMFRVIVADAGGAPELGDMLERRAQDPFVEHLRTLLGTQALSGIEEPELAIDFMLSMLKGALFWPRVVKPHSPREMPSSDPVINEAMLWLRARAKLGETADAKDG